MEGRRVDALLSLRGRPRPLGGGLLFNVSISSLSVGLSANTKKNKRHMPKVKPHTLEQGLMSSHFLQAFLQCVQATLTCLLLFLSVPATVLYSASASNSSAPAIALPGSTTVIGSPSNCSTFTDPGRLGMLRDVAATEARAAASMESILAIEDQDFIDASDFRRLEVASYWECLSLSQSSSSRWW
ncbi:hypothetical protein BC829DRAFT_386903 [Chytridium lagenaria]|nr:hypothetical protein BC829DRAFT_386903 [Chytridium lagenaria]